MCSLILLISLILLTSTLKKKKSKLDTNLPLFVIIISVPIWWNWFHKSLFCKFASTPGNVTRGGNIIWRGIGTGIIAGNGSVTEKKTKTIVLNWSWPLKSLFRYISFHCSKTVACNFNVIRIYTFSYADGRQLRPFLRILGALLTTIKTEASNEDNYTLDLPGIRCMICCL